MTDEEFEDMAARMNKELAELLTGEEAREARAITYLGTPDGHRLGKKIVIDDLRNTLDEMGFVENTDWRMVAEGSEGVTLSLLTLLKILALFTDGLTILPGPNLLAEAWSTYERHLVRDVGRNLDL